MSHSDIRGSQSMKTRKIAGERTIAFAAALVLFAGVEHAACQQEPDLRTPQAPATPQLHGPKIYGARPGHPFFYRIPCTGKRPIEFSAKSLPASLRLDRHSGII